MNSADPFATKRAAMVQLQLKDRGIKDERVLRAMSEVPRHEFVPPDRADAAYEDQPVEIGAGQTISQPYIVAAMLQSLHLAPSDKVLEIGTGSGYQTALLAQLAGQVFTVERHESLLRAAEDRLTQFGYQKIRSAVADGSQGFSEYAPYDAIIVSAAAPRVAPQLIDQLAENGRLILPVGSIDSQELQLITKRGEQLSTERLDGCRFVPLIGREGFPV